MADDTTQHALSETLQNLGIPAPCPGYVSTEPASRWDFGTVVGNGVQGALGFCRADEETLVLSHEELFLPLYPFVGYVPVREHHEALRQLVIEGRSKEAQERIQALKEQGGFPGYNTTNPFVGAAALDLHMAASHRPEAYVRSTDFSSGEAVVAWEDTEGRLFHRRFFVSRTADLLALRLTSPAGDKIDLSLRLREIEFEPPSDPRDHNIYEKTIDFCESAIAKGQRKRRRPVVSNDEDILTHRMRFKHRLEEQQVYGCRTVARVVANGGTRRQDGTWLRISGADEVLLLVRTVPERRGESLSVDAVAAALAEFATDYEALLADHAAVHGELMGRCTLSLSEPDEQRRATESVQAESRIGQTSPALVEKAFVAGRYGIVSSTGRTPPLLQGVWTGTWKPRWSGDYTLNGNVQAMVGASLCGNHFECMETLMAYLDTLMDDFRANARELLGFRGVLIPWRSSTHGRTHYLAYRNHHDNFPGIYWFAGAAWFAHLYYEYYLYTGDRAFFESRCKPFLLDAVACYEDYLTLERDGELVLAPSSSPENGIDDDVWILPNATMTIAAVKQLLRTVLRERDALGVGPERVRHWQALLAKMPSYQVGSNGALKEWSWPGIENREAHRHASHLYPLYFGVDPEVDDSETLREACRVAIDRRMEFRRHEAGGDMAFGIVQLGLSAAHLGDTPLAYECVEYLVNSYWSPAMVSLHNVKDVFNLDISGGLPALIITMLVQTRAPAEPDAPWEIRLLPCLPEAWPRGTLQGVRCPGGFEVSIQWDKGELTDFTVKSHRDESYVVATSP